MENDDMLSKNFLAFSCLVTVAETHSMGEVTQLIAFMSGINVKEKHLYVQLSSAIVNNSLENISINFNVVVEHQTSGAFDCDTY